MTYVIDEHDPSGLGMFSKAGRFTSEKYIIFQRKDEILYNKKRVLKVSSYPSLGLEHVIQSHQYVYLTLSLYMLHIFGQHRKEMSLEVRISKLMRKKEN